MRCHHYTLALAPWEHFLKAINLHSSAIQAKFFLFLTFRMKHINNWLQRAQPFIKGLQHFPCRECCLNGISCWEGSDVSNSCCDWQRWTEGAVQAARGRGVDRSPWIDLKLSKFCCFLLITRTLCASLSFQLLIVSQRTFGVPENHAFAVRILTDNITMP